MRASLLSLFVASSWVMSAQPEPTPVYRVTVVQSSIKAVNYEHRNGPTPIGFRGTVLLPDARGTAKVEGKRGRMEIEAKFTGLEPPDRFGRQYLTYVLWAITPEGRPVNLGELVTDRKNHGRLNVTTPLQAFGMLVTAEPYFAVTSPSNVVALENVLRPDTAGKVKQIDVKYELLPRGEYTLRLSPAGPRSDAPMLSQDKYEAVLELYQARNAVQIAKSEGADRYAAETFQKAEELLRQAENYQAQKAGNRQVVTTAREAAQTAEDARTITAKRTGSDRAELNVRSPH